MQIEIAFRRLFVSWFDWFIGHEDGVRWMWMNLGPVWFRIAWGAETALYRWEHKWCRRTYAD